MSSFADVIIAPDASIYVQNAPKSLAAGALPQTPLAVKGWDGDLVTTLVGVDFDMCPLACDRCPLVVLRLATGLIVTSTERVYVKLLHSVKCNFSS